jgi:hypothetical protein
MVPPVPPPPLLASTGDTELQPMHPHQQQQQQQQQSSPYRQYRRPSPRESGTHHHAGNSPNHPGTEEASVEELIADAQRHELREEQDRRRELLSSNRDLANRVTSLERRQDEMIDMLRTLIARPQLQPQPQQQQQQQQQHSQFQYQQGDAV